MARRITCAKAQRMIDELLDDQLDEADRAALDAHLLDCPDCLALRDGALRVRDLLQDQPLHPASEARVKRMWERLEPRLGAPSSAARPAPARPRWIVPAALIAATLAGVVLGWSMMLLLSSRGSTAPESEPRTAEPQERPEPRVPTRAVNAPPSGGSALVAEVIEAHGSIHLRHGSHEIISDGSPLSALSEGDRLSTDEGGRATLQLPEGVVAHLGPTTVVTLSDLSSELLSLNLARGWVVCQVEPSEPAVAFEVRAGDARVRVTGTIFAVELEDDELHVRVARGQVQVFDGAGEPVVINAEQAATFPDVRIARVDERAASRDRALIRGELVPRARPAEPVDLNQLFDEAEEARRARRYAQAATLYRRIAAADPTGATGGAALVSLGQLELGPLGRPAEAYRVFDTCLTRCRGSAHRHAAFCGIIRSSVTLGRRAAARSAARRYLDEFPGGICHQEAESILE